MRDTIQVGSAVAKRGEKTYGCIPVPSAYVGKINPPEVVVVNGNADGPTVYIGAGTHGDEFNSIEAVRRVAVSLNPKSVRGAVIFVPIHNRTAFEVRSRTTPADNKDLDCCFPGDESGSPSQVLAYLLFNEAIAKANYVLDLHTASRGGWNLLHGLVSPDTPDASRQAKTLAHLFGARVIVALEPPSGGALGESMGWNLNQNLFVQASAKNIPSVILEFGEAGRLEEDEVEHGVRGINDVLAGIGMIDATSTEQPAPFVAREAIAIRCAKQGFLHLKVRPGEEIEQGQLIAEVISFPNKVEEIRSAHEGIIVRVATSGVVIPNDRVAVVAVE